MDLPFQAGPFESDVAARGSVEGQLALMRRDGKADANDIDVYEVDGAWYCKAVIAFEEAEDEEDDEPSETEKHSFREAEDLIEQERTLYYMTHGERHADAEDAFPEVEPDTEAMAEPSDQFQNIEEGGTGESEGTGDTETRAASYDADLRPDESLFGNDNDDEDASRLSEVLQNDFQVAEEAQPAGDAAAAYAYLTEEERLRRERDFTVKVRDAAVADMDNAAAAASETPSAPQPGGSA